jgi:hypothetical protein
MIIASVDVPAVVDPSMNKLSMSKGEGCRLHFDPYCGAPLTNLLHMAIQADMLKLHGPILHRGMLILLCDVRLSLPKLLLRGLKANHCREYYPNQV